MFAIPPSLYVLWIWLILLSWLFVLQLFSLAQRLINLIWLAKNKYPRFDLACFPFEQKIRVYLTSDFILSYSKMITS